MWGGARGALCAIRALPGGLLRCGWHAAAGHHVALQACCFSLCHTLGLLPHCPAGRAQPTYLSDSTEGGSWEVEEVPAGSTYSSDDSLSEWSDVDGGVDGCERPEAAGTVEPAAEKSPGGDDGRPAPLTPSPPRRPTAAALANSSSCQLPLARQAAVPRQNPYQRHSLAVWLAARRSGGQPARVLNPQLCFTEAELLQQVGWGMLESVCTFKQAQLQLAPVQGRLLALVNAMQRQPHV